MSQTIFLEVSHPRLAPGAIDGFRFLWAYYVNGYAPERHCQACFKGRAVEQFSSRTARSGHIVELDDIARYPYVYICGVAAGPRRGLAAKTLHLPLQYHDGHVTEATTYNGYVFRARNAVAVPIPPLPDGWNGIEDREHTRCRNFQFAVAVFGYPTLRVLTRSRGSGDNRESRGVGRVEESRESDGSDESDESPRS